MNKKSVLHNYNLPLIFSIPVIFLISFFFSIHSCKNDFEVIDEWKDRMIVYGILDQNNTVQYIRIQRAFLGKESAYTMAQNSDSIYYASEICDTCVKFLEMNGETVNKTIYLSPSTDYNKDSGIFATAKHLLYKTTATLDADYSYQLIINNNKAKKTISSSTPLIPPFAVTDPKIGGAVSFYNQGKYQSPRIEWVSAPNSRLYQVTIQIHYQEDDNNDFSSPSSRYLDWVFPMLTTQSLDGGEVMRNDANGEDFYKFIASSIKEDASLFRKFINIDFIFFAAGDELATYYSINQPSLGLVQEKPEYTNIKNDKGEDEIGIFSCRFTQSVAGKIFTDESCLELKSGQYTNKLRFVKCCCCQEPPICN